MASVNLTDLIAGQLSELETVTISTTRHLLTSDLGKLLLLDNAIIKIDYEETLSDADTPVGSRFWAVSLSWDGDVQGTGAEFLGFSGSGVAYALAGVGVLFTCIRVGTTAGGDPLWMVDANNVTDDF